MAKITIEVDRKNLHTVLNIIENLKDGLINDIQTNDKVNLLKKNQPKPESPQGQKYISRSEFKNRLSRKKS
jgi:sulfatase maturation enzyme AslB (radical SAM superfamily)